MLLGEGMSVVFLYYTSNRKVYSLYWKFKHSFEFQFVPGVMIICVNTYLNNSIHSWHLMVFFTKLHVIITFNKIRFSNAITNTLLKELRLFYFVDVPPFTIRVMLSLLPITSLVVCLRWHLITWYLIWFPL